MQQVLHIFRKDVQHFWREIVVILLLLALYAYHEVHNWSHGGGLVAYGIGAVVGGEFLLGLVTAILPLAWIFVITRIVHEESLVGDRQFWVTRPYQWQPLLAAKILFVLAFLSFPAFVLQLILLSKAGFSPAAYWTGLIGLEIGTGLLLLFPVFVLSTITATFALFGLAVVCVLVFLIGASYVGFYTSGTSAGESGLWMVVLVAAAGIAVILLQYARRKTVLSRSVLAGVALLIFVAALIPHKVSIDGEYPPLPAGQQPPASFSFQPPKRSDGTIPGDTKLIVGFPLAVRGIAEPSIVKISGQQIILDAPNGLHWESGWQMSGEFLFAERQSLTINSVIDRKIFEQVKTTPVKIALKLALTTYQDSDRRELAMPAGRFEVSGVGRCASNPLFGRQIHCQAPLHQPEFLLVTAELSKITCPLLKDELPAPPGEIGRGYVVGGEPGWIQPGISPIVGFSLYLTDYKRADEHRPQGICPGTPIVLSHPKVTGKTQIELPADNVKLDDYAMRIGGSYQR